MSLAQHVTQTEGFDYADQLPPGNELRRTTTADGKPEWRHMSFAPVDLATAGPHTAAYRVSAAKRCIQVATGIVACWLSAGIVFGFAALKPVLIAEGVYSDLCHTSGERIDRYDMPCDKQDMALNLFFIVASVTANVSSLLAGSALDTYGRRACWIVGCICLTVGSLLMGTSFAIRQFDGYIVANVLLSLGGTFIFVPSFRLANAFPKYSGMIVALVTGAFDASAAVFLLYRLLYEATDGRFSIDTFFYGYTAVPALLVMAEFAYMPPSPYHNITELERKIDKAQDDSRDAHESDQEVEDMDELTMIQNARADRRLAKLSSIEDVAGNTDHREERRRIKVERQTTSGVWGVLHGLPAQKQMLTPWFSLILVLTTIQMMRMNYFIATIRAQYQFMLGSERPAGAINRFFDIALPVGGVASTPFIGVLLNNFSVPAVFATLTVFIAAIGVLNCLPYVWAGYATVVAFVIFRPLYYSAVSDYATKVFGFATFGRIYGAVVCGSGLINLSQSGLDALTHNTFQGDPFPVNVSLAVAGTVASTTLTIFIAVRGYSYAAKEKQRLGSLGEWEPLVSGSHVGYGGGA